MSTPIPTLTSEQQDQLQRLAPTVDRDQAIWLSGYFAGLAGAGTAPAALPADDGAAAATAAPAAPAARRLTVLYGTDTGNSREVAGQVAAAATAQGVPAEVADMADYKTRLLKDEQDLVVIAATHGEGDPPPSAIGFFEFLAGRKAPKLPDVRFAVLALGDSTYEHYCSAGKQLDARLEELGASRLADRVDCDVDYEDDAEAWIADVVARLVPDEPPAGAAAAVPAGGAPSVDGAASSNGAVAHGKKHPFAAPLLENVVLTGRGSSKETRHVELSLEGSGLTYEPGDALGVVPQNDPQLVEALLDRLALSGDATVPTKQGDRPLREALTHAYEITAGTPRFIEQWATLSGAGELEALRDGDAKARFDYLHEHHVLDIVERFPVPGLDAAQLLAGLRPLQPRLYSIASSLAAAPDEAHLTVSTVRFELHGRPRTGVASGHLARIGDAEDLDVPVYVQANEHFRLPADDVPIIMVGAGTGVAPYRAFLQEREARGAEGRNWLVFGERNFRSDFLYQVEWQQLLKDGVLTRLDPAFSRDATPKTYVQDRLRQAGRDVWAWLEDGARIYVCGDATNMAPDVDATLAEIVAEHGGKGEDDAREYLSALKREHRYLLDVY
ncbi:assimilatory sulfite reductase (NADPH) flavoprotein subunit [Patulibacter brassicae]|uniref:Assimilatory sulfite reductase (NADPH) flavoprotein subunit n=1 Tax=Patulibacter brassicae TaxID=1705717 RepID=A0ABU4VI02_9ACTN|nr:assimilatory sulfite reductase (NADPH) flavoprotein subunit [Patulibacter brassicae]MDX8151449.1 assimilatory sulfite reductase (NADPH) flavoprotein subunit [Patulibacter brassicae]